MEESTKRAMGSKIWVGFFFRSIMDKITNKAQKKMQ